MESSRFFAIPNRSVPNMYTCLLAIGNVDYICQVSQNPLYFEGEPKLIELLKGKEKYLQKELERSPSIDSFCERIIHFISKLTPSKLITQFQPPSAFFRRILEEIKEIGWDLVSKIDPTLTYIEVSLSDDSGRKINIRFDLDIIFPRVAPKVNANIPIPVQFEWDPMSSHLVHIVELHKKAIQNFQQFWKQMDDLDKNSFVIEPREPSLSCCMRRIVLTNLVQLQIEISPKRPNSIPRVLFFGAEQPSKELRNKFMAQSNQWRLNRSIRKNIESILELKLPLQDDDDLAQTDFDCGICYCERIGAELPEIVCEKCSKRFHRSCLLEWLRTRPNAEQSFQVVFGTCPFCDAPIQCTVN